MRFLFILNSGVFAIDQQVLETEPTTYPYTTTNFQTITTTLSDSPYLPNEYLSDEYSSFESDAILFGDSVEFDITNRIDEPELIDVEELENHLESRSTRR